jgi:dTDP-glucose 4,6-dehydratase
MTTQRVLVIGGAGFLGSHLCDHYIANGWETICLDNESSGLAANVGHLMDHSRFTYIRHDITQEVTIDGPVDLVLHMASLASPPFYKRHPIDTLLVGSMGTLNALKLGTKKNARVVFASTSEVYGDPQISPQPESYWGHVNPIGPRSMYDESKRFGEALAVAFQAEHNTDVGIVRIFNTFGPRMRPDDGRVVTQFLGQILRNEPLTIHGTGQQTRSFCFVGDMIEGIASMGGSPHVSGPINLGNPHNEMSILTLGQRLSTLFGSPFQRADEMPPQDENDPKQRCPDIGLARETLGWEPRTSFEDGMRATFEWLQSQATR